MGNGVMKVAKDLTPVKLGQSIMQVELPDGAEWPAGMTEEQRQAASKCLKMASHDAMVASEAFKSLPEKFQARIDELKQKMDGVKKDMNGVLNAANDLTPAKLGQSIIQVELPDGAELPAGMTEEQRQAASKCLKMASHDAMVASAEFKSLPEKFQARIDELKQKM